jgi:hypothetical protein
MPNRWPIANGNWSDTAIWNGGLGLPTASDDVYANLKTVVIDTNVTVFRMTNAASASAILGGGTFLLANGVTLTATSPTGITPFAPVASGSVLLISGSNSATIIGNLRPLRNSSGAWPSGSAGLTLSVRNNAQVTITGSVAGNSGFIGSIGITVSGSGAVVNISGSVETGPGQGGITSQAGISVSPRGSVNINGNVSFFNITDLGAANAIVFNSSDILTITGSVIQTDANNSTIANTSGTGSIYISGSLIGRTTSTSAIISKTTAGDIIVIGNLLGPTSANAISHTSTGNIIVSGSIIKIGAGIPISTTGASTTIVTGSISFTGSISGPVISSTSTSGLVRIASPVASFNTFNPIYSPRIQYFSDSRPAYTFQSDTFGKDVTFYDVSYTASLPSQTDVRSGSLYGGSNEFSGSMVVPSTGSVRFGVPVDNTTGSATLTPQDILTYATQNLTGSNTIGARLRNISTTQTAAATIAAFKGK